MRLMISDVIHKAFVAVDERRVLKRLAATAMVATGGASKRSDAEPPKPIERKSKSPILFLYG